MSNAVSAQVVRFVRRRAGHGALEAMLRLACETRPVPELENLESWSTWGQVRALLVAAGTVLGGSEVLREVAADWVRVEDSSGPLVSVLRSLGSPQEVIRIMDVIASRFSTAVHMEAVEVHDWSGVVTAESVAPHHRYRELCDFTAGLLSIPPMLFGLAAATVEEVECEVRGDERCRYAITWAPTDGDVSVEYLSGEL